ncbi:MAG: penicillin-binding protein 2 [Pseudomonadota bacterium]|nr:penicillin-binding protein 2 [Pseudomonadota bacterium]
MQTKFSNPEVEKNIFLRRATFALLFISFLTILLFARYFNLQITNYENFVTYSENNRVHVRPLVPARGVIYDRNGEILAHNVPITNLSIVKEHTDDLTDLIERIKLLIEIDESDVSEFHQRLARRKPYEPTPLKYDLSEHEQAILAVNEYMLDGIEISAKLKREYPQKDLFAHVIGYTGRINESDLQVINSSNYRGIDNIGKTGLEKFHESLLLGEVGNQNVETNARGRIMRTLSESPPKPGTDLMLTLDKELQLSAFEAFEGRKGALVAMNIENGDILALLSSPSFDPNLFTSGISKKQYNALLNSTEKPLFNRAIAGQYPPGSTVKPLFGLIGLTTNKITPKTTIQDTGLFFIEGVDRAWREPKKGGHGSFVDLDQAITESCDVFFYELGFQVGIDMLADMSERFGLGRKTEIDLPGEASGIMPTREWKMENRGSQWFDGDTVNASIGQGYLLTTPIQLALMTSMLANRGKSLVPQLVKNKNLIFEAQNKPEIKNEHWEYIHNAMTNVVHSEKGTAKLINKNINYKIAGKTGTAQVVSIAEEDYDKSKLDPSQWDHALFIAFAPKEQPEIAVALIVENGEFGSVTAAPIAKKVIETYMKRRMLVPNTIEEMYKNAKF